MYIAKLRLLEHGFLLAAKALEDLNIRSRDKASKKDEEDEEDEPAESYEEFEARVNLFVASHLTAASGSKRDAYKDALVYQARKDLISDFLKTAMRKKCENKNCGAYVTLSQCSHSDSEQFV